MRKRGRPPKAASAEAARLEHVGLLPGCPSHLFVDAALTRLAPTQTIREIVALFDGRATYSAIRGWRSGRAGVPQWALDLIRLKALRQADPALVIAEIALTVPAGPGYGWNKNATRGLGEWRAKRNLRRDA